MAISESVEPLKNMRPQMRGEFLICSMPPELLTGDLIAGAMAVFREREGISLIVPELSRAKLPQHAKASAPLVLITLNVGPDAEAVAFLAVITGALAKEGIAAKAMSAFHHTHLLVPRTKAEKAMEILKGMAKPK
ncbi:ACT domain protein [Candidatus Burarchaeum australiense]|nr:ACT domain protein [Candidatus Burarchaeum australiense]